MTPDDFTTPVGQVTEAEYAGALETAEEAEREANEVWTS